MWFSEENILELYFFSIILEIYQNDVITRE